jgi:hypothetical protein
VLNKVRAQLKHDKEQEKKKREELLMAKHSRRSTIIDRHYEDVKTKFSRETSKSADKFGNLKNISIKQFNNKYGSKNVDIEKIKN